MNSPSGILQSVLFNISQLLQINNKPKQIFTNVLSLTQKIIPFERSALYLYDSRTKQVELTASIGDPIDLVDQFHFEKGNGLSGWIAEVRRPVKLGNLHHGDTADQKTVRSFLSVPLLLNDELVGVLNCGHTQPQAFESNDLVRLQIIGSQIAGIVEHVRSTIALKQKNAELEAVNTELRTTQHKLIESEKLAIIGEMAVSLSHEINNPLTIISGTTQLLHDEIKSIKDSESFSDIHTQFELIEKQIQRIASVLQQLFHIKTLESEEYSPDGTRMLKLDPTYE